MSVLDRVREITLQGVSALLCGLRDSFVHSIAFCRFLRLVRASPAELDHQARHACGQGHEATASCPTAIRPLPYVEVCDFIPTWIRVLDRPDGRVSSMHPPFLCASGPRGVPGREGRCC